MADRVIYTVFSEQSETGIPFPYAPVCDEKDADYICFTDRESVHSGFWKIIPFSDLGEISDYLKDYKEKYEIRPDEIQIHSFSDEDPAVIAVPSLEELPDVEFRKEKMTKTSDEEGNYIFQKNKTEQGGSYEGRELLLTIGVPVSDQIGTIDRCLSHIKPLLDRLPAELLVVDTGSTDGTVEVCKKYGARVIDCPWCNNMSYVRNAAINNARGLWYLSIDDDEWFEDVSGILEFFESGQYRDFDAATYIQRNYHDSQGKTFTDHHTLRMARITENLHFEGRIHDALTIGRGARMFMLQDYAHHYGFVRDDEQKGREKYQRNCAILLQDVYEYPLDLRYNYQLANELKCQAYTDAYIAYFLRGVSIARELDDPYNGRMHAINLLSGLCEERDERFFEYLEIFQNSFELYDSEQAFLYYYQASLGLWFYHPAEEVLENCEAYEQYLKKYLADPSKSQLYTGIGTHVCDNEYYRKDGDVMKFCAYAELGRDREALDLLEEIEFDEILGQKRPFLEAAVSSSEPVWQEAQKKLDGRIEFYLQEILTAAVKNVVSGEKADTDNSNGAAWQRLSDVLSLCSVHGIDKFLQKYLKDVKEEEREMLEKHAMAVKPEVCGVQEQFFYTQILKQCIYEEKGKEDLELFLQYVCFAGGYCSGCFSPVLLQEEDCYAISPDLRAAYEIYQALLNGADQRRFVAGMRNALRIFPGYKKGIQEVLNLYLTGN